MAFVLGLPHSDIILNWGRINSNRLGSIFIYFLDIFLAMMNEKG